MTKNILIPRFQSIESCYQDAEQEDNLLKFKEQMNSTKKITVSENIELIRLRREIKEKSLAFESMQTKWVLPVRLHGNSITTVYLSYIDIENYKIPSTMSVKPMIKFWTNSVMSSQSWWKKRKNLSPFRFYRYSRTPTASLRSESFQYLIFIQNQIKHGPRSDLKSAELKQTIYDLEREVEILKDANERLTNK